ncbi:hypothetical protein C5B42_03325 [Candidatus Cerribacteria bacterium 'Amazon FNV 2010 28 9']|uniref:MacB-like periplasmic core domain-containing protein n=1 Tax=Candidatus Cerribacteria bacterium 'Amazon FNV 2010 28 9' TaxID=2081795 RepID=A0A317JNH9_9BACT|nr:MAG: hypothetical protein C5B42_03325 [Candidatus Cerribacteria bacterium 'Amazon FNV 2010 28 9']
MKRWSFLPLITIVVFLCFRVPQACAVDDLSIAHPVSISGAAIEDGSIVGYLNTNYHVTTEAYDKTMYGVVNKEAAVELQYAGDTTDYPVVTTGIVAVRVSGESGAIHKGDIMTSSSSPGVAMRATKSGFVLGVAQDDFVPSDPKTVGTIPVALDIKFAFAADSPGSETISTRLLDLVKLSTIATVEQPTVALRYLVSALLSIGSVVFTVLSFARVAHKGTEALGRNPLASRSILLGMIVNCLISLAILGSGLGAAYVIMHA